MLFEVKHLKNLKIMQRRIIFLYVIYYSFPHVEFVLEQTTKSIDIWLAVHHSITYLLKLFY